MQDELEDNQEDYQSSTYEDCCKLLSTIVVKDENRRASTQIKKIVSARSASLYDSEYYIKIPRKNKERTGVLHSNKGPRKKAHKYHGTQRDRML